MDLQKTAKTFILPDRLLPVRVIVLHLLRTLQTFDRHRRRLRFIDIATNFHWQQFIIIIICTTTTVTSKLFAIRIYW